MSLAKTLVVFLAAVASVNGLTTGHAARHNIHHRGLAARAAHETRAEPLEVRQTPSRTLRKRCQPKLVFVTPSASPSSDAVIPPVNVAPVPTTANNDKPAAPEPTPSPSPSPDPAPAPSPAPVDNSGPDFMRGTQTGEGTYYDTGLGACGITNNDSDYIAAVSHLLFDNFPGYDGVNPNNNPMCGRSVTVNFQGRSIVVKLTDRCTGCAVTDLDFSPAAFKDLAPNGDGRIRGITWTWN